MPAEIAGLWGSSCSLLNQDADREFFNSKHSAAAVGDGSAF